MIFDGESSAQYVIYVIYSNSDKKWSTAGLDFKMKSQAISLAKIHKSLS